MTAHIFAFPIHLNRPIVRRLASEMAMLPDDQARDFLILHLELQWNRLEFLAIECSEIEQHIDAYARAIWHRAFSKAANSSETA